MNDATPTAPQPQTKPELEAAPASWPGAFGAYKYSRAAVMFNIETVIIAMVALIAVYVGLGILTGLLGLPEAVSNIVQFVVSGVITAVEAVIFLASVNREKISFGDAINKAGTYILPILGQSIILAAILIGSFVLFVIPFFFVLPRIVLAPYYLVDKDMGPVESIKASWNSTKGHAGKAWGAIGATILMSLLVLTIIGIPVAVYLLVMYSAVFVVLYRYILNNQTQTTTPAVEPVATPTV